MTSANIVLNLEERTVLGKGLKGLRKDGRVPAVLHNHGKESVHVTVDFIAITKAYAQAGKHHPVDLTIGTTKQLAIIKDVDFEPAKHLVRHVVFQSLKQNEKTTAEIPVVLVGDEIPAQKKSLLILTQLDVVEVEALPRDLPDQLTVDATTLSEVGDKLHVSDITAPKGVVILTDGETQIATVEMPKDQIAEADAAAADLAADANVPVAEDEAPAADADAKEADKAE